MSGPQAADNHYVKALRMASERAGRTVEIDRPTYRKQPHGSTLRIFTGEAFDVRGREPPSSGTLSVQVSSMFQAGAWCLFGFAAVLFGLAEIRAELRARP